MKDRMTLTFTNSKGLELVLGDSKPLVYLSTSGLDSMGTQAQYSKAPFQLGKTFLYNDIGERQIVVNAALVTDTEEEQEQYRKHILRVLNPLLGCKMRIDAVTSEKSADIVVTSTPKFKDDDYKVFRHILEWSFTVAVPDAFISDLDDTVIELTQVVPLFEFPFEVLVDATFEVGTLNKGAVNFYNDGDAPAPFIVEIFGATTNPIIKNVTTGEFIEVKVPLLHGEKLTINTSFSNKSVVLTRNNGKEENAFHYINLESVFFQLDIGDNNIEFDAEAGNDTATVTIYYKKKWSGV